ncbi:MAG: hemerythrin family protein [Thermoplasmata archaeon]|nr:hemerythrin family protein [Thermoplasmata archaeon]
MTEIAWTPDLKVGVDLIDDQHKQLIEKMNELDRAVKHSRGVPKIIKTLDFLIEYTDFHFGTEEKNMVEMDYPQYEYHSGQHREFVSTLKNLEMDFEEEGATEALAESINTFMFNWLVKHIKTVDVQFGRFLDDKGATMHE